MRRLHALIVSSLLAAAAVAGGVAVTRTVHLGQAAGRPSVSSTSLAARRSALDRYEAALVRERSQRPPVLPPVPKLPHVRVPPPRIVVIPASPAPVSVDVRLTRPVHAAHAPASSAPTTTPPSAAPAVASQPGWPGDDGSHEGGDGVGD